MCGEADGNGCLKSLGYRLALFLKDSLVKQLDIEVVADALDISVLLGTEKVTDTADFHIAQCNLEARTELRKLADGFKPLFRNLRKSLSGAVGEVCVCLSFASTDSTADLVKLRKAEVVGILNNQRVRIRKVDTSLNNRGADKHIYLTADKLLPDVLKLLLLHSSVCKCDTGVGNCGLYPVGNKLYILDFVVEIKHLTVSVKLAADGIGNHTVVVLHNICLHGSTVAGCLVKHRNVADSAHRHIERTGDRSRRKHQSVNISCHFTQFFLLCNTKTLLLVYDEKSEVTELYIL